MNIVKKAWNLAKREFCEATTGGKVLQAAGYTLALTSIIGATIASPSAPLLAMKLATDATCFVLSSHAISNFLISRKLHRASYNI